MGIHNDAPSAPDTYGLMEYKITEVLTEIDGPDVRMICGIRRGGITHWLYSCVMRADLLSVHSATVHSAAEEATSIQHLLDHRRDH